MVCIIDYGMGNTGSVKNALDFLGYESIISDNYVDFKAASHLILPGVGAFRDGMRHLHERNLTDVLRTEVIEHGKPFLGICLGLQMLASSGEEGGTFEGLGWIAGKTKILETKKSGLCLPHVGWNEVSFLKNSKLLEGIKRPIFYFTHSYHIVPENPGVVSARAEYGESFAA